MVKGWMAEYAGDISQVFSVSDELEFYSYVLARSVCPLASYG